MKSLHLTMMIFFQVLLASAVLYLTTFAFTLASPLADLHQQEPVQQVAKAEQAIKSVPVSAAAPSPVAAPSDISGKSSAVPQAAAAAAEPIQPQVPAASKPEKVTVVESIITEKKDVPAPVVPKKPEIQAPLTEKKHVPPVAGPVAVVQPEPASKPVVPAEPVVVVARSEQQPLAVQVPQPAALVAEAPVPAPTPVVAPVQVPVPAAVEAPVEAKKSEDIVKARSEPEAAVKPSVVVKENPAVVRAIKKESVEKSSVVKADDQLEKRGDIPAKPVADSVARPQVVVSAASPVALVVPVAPVESKVHSNSPTYSAATPAVVKGGLGPLHLLATTLCSYQPDRLVADDSLNQLYSRRAVLRKSLFEFMSLKFTNLEKLSSRLGSGLQVVPVKSVVDPADPANSSRGAPSASVAPSHGWPVVGKCTAHDLKLMGEAAWCENEQPPAREAQQQQQQQQQQPEVSSAVAEDGPAKIASNKHMSRVQAARSIVEQPAAAFLPSPEQSSVISKLLHVSDIKDAPLVESSIYNLNLTQQQLATLEAHATSTRECRRNALRYTKALFNHLAEDQKSTSDSWPKLYALISADDCARKRMIDIITALSGFRTDVTSIRRDNLEFAFAMDDLRTKVLENEVNVALTFDKQFIEVEQFLQQSVQLMLSNIDPNKAKITSMRYRSLMYGSTNSDDQCIDIHQRLLAQSYPTDCNPTQFGQLPDVLRMTASSLELWSIEKEISLHISRVVDYPNSNPAGQQKVKEDVNECIANLVSS